jgi:hypothetical protein
VRVTLLLPFAVAAITGSLAACDGDVTAPADASTGDAAADAALADALSGDAPAPDAAGDPDGAADADLADAAPTVPLPGFGDITGSCGILGEAELTGADPSQFYGEITFADRYDDPEDRPYLTPGGVEMILDGNAGGSSVYSEVFAYELLARCELAELLKTETEIVYDVEGKKTDLLVAIDGHKIGVSVTRAVTYPFDTPYTLDDATHLIERKLDDILLSTANVSDEDRWEKQILAVLAYDQQHADTVAAAYAGLDDETRADTILLVTVTSGDDLFVYTDR